MAASRTNAAASRKQNSIQAQDLEQLYSVPENWAWFTLGTLCDIYTGNSINQKVKQEKYFGQTEGLAYIATKDVGFDGVVDYDNGVRIPDFSKFKIAPANTALLCIEGGSAGRKIGYINRDVCFVNKLCAFVGKSVHPKFVYYYLQTPAFREQFNSRKHGLIGGVSVRDLATIRIACPDLEEQARITHIIDHLFHQVNSAQIVLCEMLEESKTRQAALLHQAMEGALTERWRYVHHVSKEDTWANCELIKALKAKPRNGNSPKPVNYVTPYRNLILSAVTSGYFQGEYYKYVDIDIPDDSYLWLMPGDILLQRSNSLERVGTSALYTGGPKEFIYPDLMMKLQVNDSAYAPFIAYQLKTGEVMGYLRSHATGTAGNMPKVNQKTVSNIPIVLPTIEEQIEIARLLDINTESELQLQANLGAALEYLNQLKTSILVAAFSGDLHSAA